MTQYLDGTQDDEILAQYLQDRFGDQDTRIVVSYASKWDAAVPFGDRVNKQVTLGDGRLLRCCNVSTQHANDPRTIHVIVERPNPLTDLDGVGGPLRFRAGVFDYCGCGEGRYWSVSGKAIDCNRTEAREHAAREGVEFVFIDRMVIATGHTPDWKHYLLPQGTPAPMEDSENVPLTYKEAYDALHARVSRMAQSLRAKGQGAWVDSWLGDGILDVKVVERDVGNNVPEPEQPTTTYGVR